MAKDTFFINLAEDITLDYVLAVLAAVQGLEAKANAQVAAWNSQTKDPKYTRVVSLDIHIYSPYKDFEYIFRSCLTMIKDFYSEEITGLKGFECVVELSLAQAISIAEANAKPLAQAFGILLGSDADSLPDVSNLCPMYEQQDYILTTEPLFEHISALSSFATYKVPLSRRILNVFESKAIVSYSGFETYLACCLKKPVIEIQDKLYLSKWSNPNYVCIEVANLGMETVHSTLPIMGEALKRWQTSHSKKQSKLGVIGAKSISATQISPTK